jgi:hypothetical protein
MILLYLFLIVFPIYTYTAEHDHYFEAMREHVERCSVDCTKIACVQKYENIPDEGYQSVYKSVYGTYHSLAKISIQSYGQLYLNYFGEVILSPKDAATKNALILFRRPENRDNFELRRSCEKNKLSVLRAPSFNTICATTSDAYHKKTDDSALRKELMCCARECPNEVIDILCDYDAKIGEKPLYLYYFLDTKEMPFQRNKGFLFCIVEITNSYIEEKLGSLKQEFGKKWAKVSRNFAFSILEYRSFFVDRKFTIESLHTGIDLYGNDGKRIVMSCSYEEKKGFLYSAQKKMALVHLPYDGKQRRCGIGGGSCNEGKYDFLMRNYTIEAVKKQHTALARAEVSGFWDKGYPFHCDHAHFVTGSEKELTDYVAAAFKRTELGTSCLVKNEAASSSACTVYHNPFGEFVVKRNGMFFIVPGYTDPGYEKQSHLYYAVHNSVDLFDAKKMQQRAQYFAQRWQKTYDDKFLYCWEEDPKDTCTKAWPYGRECSWQGNDDYAYKVRYQRVKNIDLCEGGLESFKKWRLWIAPLTSLLFQNAAKIDFSMVYTDWPYEITLIENKLLTLRHDESNYDVHLDLQHRNIGKYHPLVQIFFEGHQAMYNDGPGDITLRYIYKDPVQLVAFKERKQLFDMQKQIAKQSEEQAEQESREKDYEKKRRQKRIEMGLETQETQDNKMSRSNFLATLHNSAPKIVGGLALGVLIAGVFWYLQKHSRHMPDQKLPNTAT